MTKIIFSTIAALLFTSRSTLAQIDSALIYNYYHTQFNVEKFVLYVDQKNLEDSTRMYTLISPCSWSGIITTIPYKYYNLKNKALICYFDGSEDYSKMSEVYVKEYLDTLTYFLPKDFSSEQEFRLISWQKKQIKMNIKGICDEPIFSLIIKNGKIIQDAYAKSRLYWKNQIQYQVDYVNR